MLNIFVIDFVHVECTFYFWRIFQQMTTELIWFSLPSQVQAPGPGARSEHNNNQRKHRSVTKCTKIHLDTKRSDKWIIKTRQNNMKIIFNSMVMPWCTWLLQGVHLSSLQCRDDICTPCSTESKFSCADICRLFMGISTFWDTWHNTQHSRVGYIPRATHAHPLKRAQPHLKAGHVSQINYL